MAWFTSCHLRADCTPRSAPGPTLGNEYGKTLPLHTLNMSLHYVVKYEWKNGVILKYIAKNLTCDELLYYTFVIHCAGEGIFKIGEHLAKSLTVIYPFALHFCPQRCRCRQISWITCVLQTETVLKHCSVNRQIDMSASNCSRPVLTYWLTDWGRQWLTDYWTSTAFCCDSFSLLLQLWTVVHAVFCMANVNFKNLSILIEFMGKS